MRALILAGLLAFGMPGCLGEEPAAPQLESFEAVFGQGYDRYRVSLTGPEGFVDRDGEMRQGYRLEFQSLRYSEQAGQEVVDAVRTQVLDATGHVMRSSLRCIPESTPDNVYCGPTWVEWDHKATLPWHGIAWPLVQGPTVGNQWVGSQTVARRSDGGILVAEAEEWPYGVMQYEYEGTSPVPLRAYQVSAFGERSVEWQRESYRRLGPLDGADAWPDVPIVGIDRTTFGDGLFPGADSDPLGFGFTSLQALDALRFRSSEAADRLDSGGCVVRVQVTPPRFGQTGFASGIEQELVDAIFVIQDSGLNLREYTVRWVEYPTGDRDFSLRVGERQYDPLSQRPCRDRQHDPWPTYAVADFLELQERLDGRPPRGYSASQLGDFITPWERQPQRLSFQYLAGFDGSAALDSLTVDAQTGWITVGDFAIGAEVPDVPPPDAKENG